MLARILSLPDYDLFCKPNRSFIGNILSLSPLSSEDKDDRTHQELSHVSLMRNSIAKIEIGRQNTSRRQKQDGARKGKGGCVAVIPRPPKHYVLIRVQLGLGS